MTCQEALRLLYEVIDKEASQIDTKEVEEHLRHCRSCMARYQFEEMFKTFVIEKAASVSKSEDLKAKILSKIRQAETDHGNHNHKNEPLFIKPFRFRMVYLAAAAALIICVVAALAAAKLYRHRAFVVPFEKDHMGIHAMNVSELDPQQHLNEVRQFVTNDMHLAMGQVAPEYTMTSCCFKEMQGKKFAHLRFARGDSHISIFVGQAEGVQLPDFEPATYGGVEYFRKDDDDCRMIYWRLGEALVVAVTDDKSLDLTQFMPALASL